MALLTVSPDAGTGSTTVDGQVVRDTNGTWSQVRDGAGDVHTDSASVFIPAVRYATTQWDYITRAILTFDVSTIPSGATLIAATLRLRCSGKLDHFTDSLSVVSATPASDNDLVDADYGQVGTTLYATAVALSGITVSAWNTISLNSTGLSHISSAVAGSGIAKLGLRMESDRSDTEPSASGTEVSYVEFASADSSNDPQLIVWYAESGQVGVMYVSQRTVSSTSSGSLTDPSNTCETPCPLQSGTDYLCLYSCNYSNSGNNDSTEVALNYGGTIYARQVSEGTGSGGRDFCGQGMCVLSGDGSSTVKWQFRTLDTSTTAEIDEMSIVCIPLDDLTENTDYYKVSVNGDTETDSNLSSWTTIESVTFTTTSSRPYLVIGSVELLTDGGNGAGGLARLTVDGSAQSYEGLLETEDATDVHGFCFASIFTGSGSSQTIAIQANGRNGDEDARRGRIFVLDTTAFATNEITNDTDSTGTNTNATELLTISTARSSNPAVLMASATAGSDATTTAVGYTLRDSSDVTLFLTYGVENDPGFDSARDQLPIWQVAAIDETGNGANLLTSQYVANSNAWGKNPANTAGVKSELVLWGMVLASAGTLYQRTFTSYGIGTTSLTKSINKMLPATGTGTVSLSKSISKIFSSIGIGTAAYSAHKLRSILLSAVGVGTAALKKGINKMLPAVGSGQATMQKSLSKTMTATGVGQASLTKSISKTLAAIGVGVANFAAHKMRMITLACVGVGTTVFRKSIAKTFQATGTGTVSISKSISKILATIGVGTANASVRKFRAMLLACVGVGSATMRKSVSKTFSSVGIGSVTVVKSTRKTLSAVGTGTVTLTKSIGKTFAAAGIGTVTLTRRIGKTLTATGVGTVSLARRIAKTLSAVGVGVTSFLGQRVGGTIQRTFACVGVGSASLTKSISKTMAATGVGTVTLTRRIGKILAAVGVGATTFSLLHRIPRAFSAVGVGTVTLTRRINKRLAAVGVGQVSLRKKIGKTFTAVGRSVLSFLASIVNLPPPFRPVRRPKVVALAPDIHASEAFPPLRHLTAALTPDKHDAIYIKGD